MSPDGVHPPLLGSSSWPVASRVETERCSCHGVLITAHGVAVPSQVGFPHLLRYCGYSESSPDVLIHYVVVEGQPKHPLEHLHFHCVKGRLMFLGRGPAFSAIEGDWANNGLVDLCLEIFCHFLITQDSGDMSPLEPRRVDSCSLRRRWCRRLT